MRAIKSYNSCYTRDEYKIGSIYSFYIHNASINHLDKAREEDVQDHVQSLNEFIEANEDFAKSDGQYLHFTRALGIIIDIHDDHITAMFKTSTGYACNDYVINTYGVFVNGKDDVTPTAIIKCK